MGRPPKEFRKLASRFVCARITDMRGVDLEVYRFDYDLTFSVLLMHPDGTIFHRFGGRDHESASKWVSMPPLLELMRRTLREHAAYARDPKPPPPHEERTIESFPTWSRWIGEKKIECAHCHQVGEHEVGSAELAGGFDRESIWRWPPPERVGLVLDPADQPLVRAVTGGSPAAEAGLAAGDRLKTLGAVAIGGVTDAQAALHDASGGATKIAVTFERGGETRTSALVLGDGWKHGDDRTFAWRPLKWALGPAPGFGGKDLDAAEKEKLGLDPARYAFRIGYLVTWGRKAHRGRDAARAGLRKGDVVYSVGGRTDLADQNHFHSWFRLHVKPGDTVEIKYLRGAERRVAKLKAVR